MPVITTTWHVLPAITAAWHVVHVILTVTGAACWALFALGLAWVYSGIRRARKQRERQRLLDGELVVAEAEAMLRRSAGGGR